MNAKRNVFGLAILLLVAAFVFGCSTSDPQDPPKAADREIKTSVLGTFGAPETVTAIDHGLLTICATWNGAGAQMYYYSNLSNKFEKGPFVPASRAVADISVRPNGMYAFGGDIPARISDTPRSYIFDPPRLAQEVMGVEFLNNTGGIDTLLVAYRQYGGIDSVQCWAMDYPQPKLVWAIGVPMVYDIVAAPAEGYWSLFGWENAHASIRLYRPDGSLHSKLPDASVFPGNEPVQIVWVGSDPGSRAIAVDRGGNAAVYYGNTWVLKWNGKIGNRTSRIALSADRTLLLAGNEEGEVIAYEVKDDGELDKIKSLPDHYGPVWGLVYDSRENAFISAGGNSVQKHELIASQASAAFFGNMPSASVPVE